jgi:hypothetical protein
MILYRPVGLKELELIVQADFRAFPPRLPEQPIFYLVLNIEAAFYGEQFEGELDPQTNLPISIK